MVLGGVGPGIPGPPGPPRSGPDRPAGSGSQSRASSWEPPARCSPTPPPPRWSRSPGSPAWAPSPRPTPWLSPGPGPQQPLQHRLLDRVQHPPGGGGRGHLPEEIGLLPQRGQIGDALPTVPQGHRQVHQHPSRIVPPGSLHQRGQRFRDFRVQPAPLRQLAKSLLPAWPTSPAPSVLTRSRGRSLNFTLKVMPAQVGIVDLSTHSFPYQAGISATGPPSRSAT